MSEYDVHAESYDALYADYDEDIPFYVEETRKAGSPVLELACGTGRVTVPVAEAGLDVVGIDSSSGMLERFRTRLPTLDTEVRDRIVLHEADMRGFDLGAQRFSLIYCPFRSFLHLLTVEDQLSALHSVRSHLVPGGRFAINFFNPSVAYIGASISRHSSPMRRVQEFIHPTTGNSVVAYLTSQHNIAQQIIRNQWIEEKLDHEGLVVSRTYMPMTLRWIYRFEFEHLLARGGFEVEALYGSFDRRPFSQDRDELIWIARKR